VAHQFFVGPFVDIELGEQRRFHGSLPVSRLRGNHRPRRARRHRG